MSSELDLLRELMADASRPPIGKWGNWTLEDFKRHYQDNYDGMSRSQVAKDRENNGSGFYRAVNKRRLVDQVFPLSRRGTEWNKMDESQLRDYYDENFPGMSPIELSEDEEGRNFYSAVVARGLQDTVVDRRTNNWKNFEEDDFRRHYETHYLGMSRTDLRNNPEGKRFYLAAYRRGLLDSIVSAKIKPKGWYKDFKNVQATLEVMIESNEGEFPRAKAIREEDPSLCAAIYNYPGNLNKVRDIMGYSDGKHVAKRSRKKNFNWRGLSDDEMRDYYQERFAGCNKVELRKTAEGRSLLGALWRRGLEDTVPNAKKPNGYYQDINNVLAELGKLKQENGGELPSSRRVLKLNSSLHSQIYRYHGGYNTIMGQMES
jgi:hypothetical protein